MSAINLHIKSGQNKWEVSIEPSQTILELKEAIAVVSSIPAANQRLIYSGKILKDDQTVESYKIQDGHAVHLVRSGGNTASSNTSSSSTATTTTTTTTTSSEGTSNTSTVPHGIATGQGSGFNPLADLTSARYAGYGLNLPSADMFGPDGGLTSSAMPNQEDMLRMLENPVFQSQMNEMLSNPQIVDFMIESNPQLRALGPQARQILQSPMFRQMLTNPDMIRQSMQFARMFEGGGNSNGATGFPAPGGETANTDTAANTAGETTTTSTNTNTNTNTNPNANANPFAALFNPALNPFLSMANTLQQQQQQQQQEQQDTRPPEERYEHQLRQLNDMGFFDFDRNVAALRRSGGSVQGAVEALLDGSV